MTVINHQLRAIGNSTKKWINKVIEWIEEERRARTASAEELVTLKKSKNPLIKLLLAEPASAPEPIVGEVEEEEEEELVVRRKRKGRLVVEDPEEEEEQFFMAELDTFVPVNMMEFAMGDITGNKDQMEEQGRMLEIDELFNVFILLEMEIGQTTDESVQVEPEPVPDEAVEERKERKNGASCSSRAGG